MMMWSCLLSNPEHLQRKKIKGRNRWVEETWRCSISFKVLCNSNHVLHNYWFLFLVMHCTKKKYVACETEVMTVISWLQKSPSLLNPTMCYIMTSGICLRFLQFNDLLSSYTQHRLNWRDNQMCLWILKWLLISFHL